ncbi:hypothetical protein [Methyloceanibacter sp.]|uniref:hypothetical protein n=1 Tax=Methyloceanibacter sp. TaxID=1965321 RepID=UPI003D6D36D2
MITLDEIRDFGMRFFNAVANGATAAEQAQFFLDPHARIYIAWNGATISLKEHETLHAQWVNEHHSFGHFELTPLNASPERVRAQGTVYWQVEIAGRPAPNAIKAVVGEDWILERAPGGALRFVLYLNTFHHLLPDSAPLDL